MPPAIAFGHDLEGMPDTAVIRFHFHDHDMDIIDSYNKLTLAQYQEIQAVQKDESLEDIDKHTRILSILTGVPEDELMHLPIPEFTELSGKAQFLSAEAFNPGRMAKKYIIGEMELIPVTDFRKLETCQYLDFQTYAGDLDKYMAELISVLLVPKGHRYNEGYDIIALQESIRQEMSVADGATIVGFFLTLCERSIEDSLNYSKRMAKGIRDKKKRTEILKRIEEQEEALRTSGDG